MLPRRRSLLLIISGAVLAVLLLSAIVPRRLALPSPETAGTVTPRDDGAAAVSTLTTPEEGLLAAQNLEYAPGLDAFEVDAFLRSIGSDLADYAAEQGQRRAGIASLVAEAAERHAVNPRVLLVLMEMATGVVSAPTPDVVMRAGGYSPAEAPDAAAQIERLAGTLSAHYVAAFMGDEPVAVRGPGGDAVRVAGGDPAAAAIALTLAETLPLGALSAAVAGPEPGFADLYRGWFGDPREIPVFARGVSLPAGAAWPFEGARRHTSGPHMGAFCSQQDIAAASGLDFGGESHEVLAMADGRYLGLGETTAAGLQAGKYVLLEHEGGVQVMYWHLGGFTPEVLALAPGTAIPKGFPVGWSGRSGNQSAVHLHVELRRGAVASNPYSGVRVSWDGQTVDGWTVYMFRWPGRSDRGISYRGSAVRGGTRVLAVGNCACDESSAEVVVSSGHPETAAPRNGMDANTVLANYPEVGLLASSNARTTTLWTTAEKAWRNRVPWYYLIDGSAGDVEVISLGGVTWVAAPECARALWLSAGEQRLTWRYRDDGTGAPAVRVLPWPFAAPACAAEASGAPPTGDVPPDAPHDDAAVAPDGNCHVDVVGQAGEVTALVWPLRNVGTTSWGEGYRLVFAEGYPLGPADGVSLPVAPPGAAVTVILPVTVPAISGGAHAFWRLRNADGVAFGPTLTASVGASPGEEVAMPTAAAPAGAPELLAPVAEGGETAYLASRDVTLRWGAIDGAEGYLVHVSLSPTPREDPSPVYREWLGAGVRERRLVFAVDVARLYWQVTAQTTRGEVASRVAAFGLDTEPPSCAVDASAVEGDVAWVTWHGEDAVSGVSRYDVGYLAPGGETWQPLVWADSTAPPEAWLSAVHGGAYAVRCRALDAAGNVGAWSGGEEGGVVLAGSTGAEIVGAGEMSVSAMPGDRLFIQAPVENAGAVPGQARLVLAVAPVDGEGQAAYRWDVVDLPPGRAVTLTAVIDAPRRQAQVGDVLDGAYRLTLERADGGGAQLAFSGDVCLAGRDPYEAWEAGEAAGGGGALLVAGGRQTRGFHVPWDVDEARLLVEPGRSYVVWTEALGLDADTVIELYDAAGQRVAVSDDGDGAESRIAWVAEDGVYRVVVYPWAAGSEGCGAGYTLRLQTEPPVGEVPEDAAAAGRIRLPVMRRPG